MKLFPLLILFLGGVILTLGDLLMKEWVAQHKQLFYLLGLGLWIIGSIFLAESFKWTNIAVASMIEVIFNIVTLALASLLFFHEDLNGLQLLGIGLGLVSVTILELA